MWAVCVVYLSVCVCIYFAMILKPASCRSRLKTIPAVVAPRSGRPVALCYLLIINVTLFKDLNEQHTRMYAHTYTHRR